MKHLGTKVLHTERLILRPFRTGDAAAMFENWASDPDVTKYLTWGCHGSVSVSEMILRDWVSSYDQADFYQWAIVPKSSGDEPVGSISVVSHNDDLQIAHVGYCIGKKWWRKGYATQALSAVIDFLFHDVGMRRVEARHDANNPNSGAVMRNCGMQYEGTLRQSDRNNQGICDACWYGILNDASL